MSAQMIFKVVYAVLGVSVLFLVISQHHPEAKNDVGILLGYVMLILSFPISVAVLVILGFVILPIGNWLNISLEFGYIYIVLYWAIFFLVGYLQWFVLLPWLVKSIKSKRSSGRPS
jgi:hypothetical protein